MEKIKLTIIVVVVIIVLSLTANIFLSINLFIENKKNIEIQQKIHLNTKVLDFANIFINKVLRAEGEISFEDRLKIENAVRDTQDSDIYNEWQKFVGAKTELEGREEIKNLLQLIVNKISSSSTTTINKND